MVVCHPNLFKDCVSTNKITWGKQTAKLKMPLRLKIYLSLLVVFLFTKHFLSVQK